MIQNPGIMKRPTLAEVRASRQASRREQKGRGSTSVNSPRVSVDSEKIKNLVQKVHTIHPRCKHFPPAACEMMNPTPVANRHQASSLCSHACVLIAVNLHCCHVRVIHIVEYGRLREGEKKLQRASGDWE